MLIATIPSNRTMRKSKQNHQSLFISHGWISWDKCNLTVITSVVDSYDGSHWDSWTFGPAPPGFPCSSWPQLRS